MLFYTENHDDDPLQASIHNLDTGLTYTLVSGIYSKGNAPVYSDDYVPKVRISTPTDGGRVLYSGDQAVAFWKMLLIRNPWTIGELSPYTLLARLPGCEAPAAAEDGEKDPF